MRFIQISTFVSTNFCPRRNFHVFTPNLHKSASSKAWIQRHVTDPYVKESKYDGYRARSAYKLLEIDEKFKILRPGLKVVDCGAAPGSWSQVLVQRVKNGQEKIVAVDMNHFSPIDGVVSLTSSDFTDEKTINKILAIFGDEKIDAVFSDMAPNATGNQDLDHFQIIKLAYAALKFAVLVLKTDQKSIFLCKLWNGGETEKFSDHVKTVFRQISIIKPHASRLESAEIFLLARNFVGFNK